MPAPTVTDKAPRDEDELEELPPLDGDARDRVDPEAEPEEELDDVGDASLDDTTGEDDPADADELDLEREEAGGGWLQEPADSPDLDLGDTALVELGDEGAKSTAADEPDEIPPVGVLDEEIGFGNDPERGGLDGGDEGPLGADDELRETDLPQLDADEEGEIDEAVLVDAGFAAEEPVGLPWAPDPWSRVGAPVGLVAAMAVACAPRGALVAGVTEGGGAELVRIDLEGTSQTLAARGLDAGAVMSLAVEGLRVAALVNGGHLRLSRDGGASFVPVAPGVSATHLALVGGALWMRTAGGELARMSDDGARAVPHGPAVALAADGDAGAGVVALVADEAGRASALLRVAPGRDAVHEVLAPPPSETPPSSPPFAVRGGHVALAARGGGVLLRDARGRWATHAWEGRLTALAFVDDAGTLVAATYSELDDTTTLVRLARGADEAAQATVVARIGPSPSRGAYAPAGGEAELDPDGADARDGRARSLVFDDARGVVWVAGGFGVAAFAAR